jgi:hypothetical protein
MKKFEFTPVMEGKARFLNKTFPYINEEIVFN